MVNIVSRWTKKRKPARPARRLSLVTLDDRCVPAVIAWDGGPTGNGTLWLDPVNWAGDVLPGASDDVTFGATGTNPAIELRGNTSVQGVTNARNLQVVGNASVGNVILTAGAGGFTNNGLIELTSDIGFASALTVTGGVLANASSGTLAAVAGAGGTRTITLANAATLDNQGTLSVGTGLTINANGASAQTLTSAGNIDVAGGNMTLSLGTGDALNTTGTVSVGLGRTFAVNGGALNYQAGTLGGAGTLALTSATFSLGVGLSNAAITLNLTDTIVNGPGTLFNAAGRTLLLAGTTTRIAAPLVNQGTLRVRGEATVGGFTNDGVVELTSDFSFQTLLRVDGGTLVNAAGRTIFTLGGNGTGSTLDLINGGTLSNQGTLSVNANLVVFVSGGSPTLTNAGTINLSSGNLDLRLGGGTFNTTGTITISAGQGFFITNGTVNYQAGTISGAGGLHIGSVTLNLGVGLSNAAGPALNFGAGTVNGPGVLTTDRCAKKVEFC